MEKQKMRETIPRSDTAKAARRSALLKRMWLTLNIIFSTIYIVWRLFFTLPFEYGIVSIIAGVVLIVVEVLGFVESLIHYYNMHSIVNYETPDVPAARLPHVDVLIATYTETTDLLYKTINGCLHMDYPDKSKVHIYLCDDGRRPEVAQLAREKGVGYIVRDDNKGAKAGNLNNALTVTSSPLLVTLDADMIPKHDFLMKTAPFFVQAELDNEGKKEKDQVKLGFVQTPQSFYNPDLFQFNLFSESRIPNEQDYFYKDIQLARNKSNSVIYGGSNTMISREAVLEVGGFYTGTITEDFATGILIQKKKYKCIAINDVVASGLSANDLDSLIQQRIRWARGCISSGRQLHILLSKDLTFTQKLNYWASIFYWYAPLKRFVYIMSPIIFAVFGYTVIKCTLLEVAIFWLPMFIISNITLRSFSQNIRTVKWTNIYETVMFPFMIIPILLESLGIRLKKFKVTRKETNLSSKTENFVHLLPFLVFIILSVIGIVNMLRIVLLGGSMSPIVVLFWLVSNVFSLVMASMFMLGRRFFRANERMQASVPCTLHTEHGEIECTTKDFSETGVSVLLDYPVDISEQETVHANIATNRYEARLDVTVVHVDPVGDQWKYALKIEDYCDTFDEYLQIIYDRIPTLPTNLSRQLSSFDDLRINITKRVAKTMYQNRRYARIDVDQDITTYEGAHAKLVNFNYKYVLLEGANLPQRIGFALADGLEIEANFERVLYSDKKLYAVTNYDEIHTNWALSARLEDWIKARLHTKTAVREATFV